MARIVRTIAVALLLAVGAMWSAGASAGSADASVPGSVSTPFPTLRHASIEWAMQGDTDLDGTVSVRFRAQGNATWRNGMPLRRVPAGSNEGFSWSNRHSGSLFGLQPATTYDVELTLLDPDGGSTQRMASLTTRSMPAAMPGAPIVPATPASLANVLVGADAGDIVQLAPGNYAAFQVPRDGAPGAPLVIRGGAGVVVNGEVGLFFRAHVMLLDLTVNGRIRFNGSDDISIVGCTINATQATQGDGIVSYLRAERAYIAGNVVNGLTLWQEASLGASGDNLGEGILVTGPGHVIESNTLRGFRDAISLLEDDDAVDQFSVDILDNDISVAADDGIEADFCFHNCRIVGNRLVNAFIAFSSQPGLGGPTYFVRNRAYNVLHLPFKLYRGSSGDVIMHNTVVKHGDALNAYPGRPISRALFRNNLLLGGAFGSFNGFSSGSGRVVDLSTLQTVDSSLDYNGYGTTLPAFGGRIGAVSFSGLSQLRSLTSEAHAQQADYAVFAAPVAFPAASLNEYALPDLRLAPASVVTDAGQVIANINDDFEGTAPDLGALESAAMPDPLTLFYDGFEAP